MGFWKYAQEDPGYLAIVDPDGTEHAAGDVLARANQVVHALRSLGMERGDAVAAVLPNGSLPMHVYLAALQAGFYYVPINYRLSPAEIAYIISDSEATVFISHERFADIASAAAEQASIPSTHRLAHGSIPGFRPFGEVVDGQPTSRPENRSTGASMHYTSGTTGQPKGVRRKLNEIDPDTSAELFTGLLLMFGIQPNDGNVHLSTSPNYHTAVTTFAGNSLHMKHTVVCMDKWDAEETLRLIDRYKCTHTHMVPTQFIRMLQLPDDVKKKYDVSSMKFAIHAAAPCPVDVKRRMLEWWGPVIWEYYAATEGGGTIAPPDEWLKYPGTVGKVWASAELKVTDDDGNRQPVGEPGVVWMKMAATFEYKGDKKKTDDSHDAEGFFTVGDIGYLNEDGYLFLCDRKSDMIIAGGVNIYPAEIEGCIHEHPQVADVAVFGVPDPDMGEQIKAVVQPLPGVAADEALRDSIMTHVREKLGKYKWPRSVDFMEELPREPTGKLLKRKLRDPYWQGQDRAI